MMVKTILRENGDTPNSFAAADAIIAQLKSAELIEELEDGTIIPMTGGGMF
jgi:hypothetical protein